MSDLFHEDVELSLIQRVFQTMEQAHWHTFQVLTKRGERLAERAPMLPWPSNVWMGVSVENQRWVSRIDYLRQTPAAVKFLSCEPLLGPLTLDLEGIDWVIVGGESGHGARPMQLDWARGVRDQCTGSNTPFFFKQHCAYNKEGVRRTKQMNGQMFEGRTWSELRRVAMG